jgi:branched-subunit amino acid ABC-type transport system permease component
MTVTVNEMPLFFGQRHEVIRRVLGWSTLVLSATFGLSLIIGGYVGDPWNNLTTVAAAGLVTVLFAYYLARWQHNGLRWLMYACVVMVVSVVVVFAVKLLFYRSTSGLWIAAPIVAMSVVVLGGVSTFLRRFKAKSTAARKRI